MRSHPWRMTAVVFALVALVAACGPAVSSPPAPPAGPAVSGAQTVLLTGEDSFAPAALRVTRGTTVTWQWPDDPALHNVTFDEFGSDTQTEGTYSHTFDEAGAFDYRCTLHPSMTGTVVTE